MIRRWTRLVLATAALLAAAAPVGSAAGSVPAQRDQPIPVVVRFSGEHNGPSADRLVLVTSIEDGARPAVRLFRKGEQGRRALVSTTPLEPNGRTYLTAPDRNEGRPTTYWVVILGTQMTVPDRSRNIRVR